VEQNEKQAFQWLLKAAQSGKGYYCYKVAECYSKGKGIVSNDEYAFQWYLKGANADDDSAIQEVAKCYEIGKGVPQSYENALKWLLRLAKLEEENHSTCNEFVFGIIACYYAKGLGTNKLRENAIYWLTKELFPDYLIEYYVYELCKDFASGTNGAEKDYAEAVFWLNYVIEKCDYIPAYCLLGRIYEEGGYGLNRDLDLAIKNYILSAEKDDFEGQMALASCYERGVGVEYSLENAFKWYQKAAEKNNDEAKIALEEFLKRHITDFESKYGFANVGKRYDLFISWNHNDKTFKDNLVNGIEAFNFDDTHMKDERVYPHYRAWESDRDAEGVIVESIRNAINNSKFFLVI
ncbi:MAG: sel1 repeat family protein, partial [Allobaculum sp.]|nr:sel1 repeat family protein [Allobaculum sp.]